MAENKKSFILYADLIHTFDELTNEEAGKLIKHLLAYVNDQDPQTDDKLLKIAFEPIKQQLKRDLKHWETIKEKRSKAGIKSAESRKQTAANSTHVNTCQQEATLSTVNDNVNDNVNVNVNVNDTVNVNVRESKERAELLENSNLFRKPNIPTLSQVQMGFMQRGGTPEMANTFFEKYSATEWFLNGSPIKNFTSLIPKFIQNWKTYEKAKRSTPTDTAKPGSVRAAI